MKAGSGNNLCKTKGFAKQAWSAAHEAQILKKARKVRKKGHDLNFAKLGSLGEEVVGASPHPLAGRARLAFGRTWARRFAARHDLLPRTYTTHTKSSEVEERPNFTQ